MNRSAYVLIDWYRCCSLSDSDAAGVIPLALLAPWRPFKDVFPTQKAPMDRCAPMCRDGYKWRNVVGALTPGLGHVESSSCWRKRDDQDYGQEELLR